MFVLFAHNSLVEIRVSPLKNWNKCVYTINMSIDWNIQGPITLVPLFTIIIQSVAPFSITARSFSIAYSHVYFFLCARCSIESQTSNFYYEFSLIPKCFAFTCEMNILNKPTANMSSPHRHTHTLLNGFDAHFHHNSFGSYSIVLTLKMENRNIFPWNVNWY